MEAAEGRGEHVHAADEGPGGTPQACTPTNGCSPEHKESHQRFCREHRHQHPGGNRVLRADPCPSESHELMTHLQIHEVHLTHVCTYTERNISMVPIRSTGKP